ncbi:OLC1v1037365C3 [Oldenlandia corymbosa var. corymbosa]|uniref:OLC1v1037365C3 n=1 Tax=Oldenlandia corymbosa var. corymbosa TaxID=529605 RepID=A0AAV1CXE6_OLDCO|nr:OLC1v1037365C3 [Oldenlandia corymbosa var. corymbosa]
MVLSNRWTLNSKKERLFWVSFVEEGIMIAADHSGKSAPNVVQLNSDMLVTISGGSESLLKPLQEKLLQERMKGRRSTFAEVSSWLADSLSGIPDRLSLGILIAVWNESVLLLSIFLIWLCILWLNLSYPNLCVQERGLYRMSADGTLVNGDTFATGSGSNSALGAVESSYKRSKPGTQTGSRSGGRVGLSSDRLKSGTLVSEVAYLAKRAICQAALWGCLSVCTT